jgi:hypothetical protein
MRKFYKVDAKDEQILVMEVDGVISFVPEDPANSDYQAYLTKDEVKADEAKTK